MKKLLALLVLAALMLTAWQLTRPGDEPAKPGDQDTTIAPFGARSRVPLPEPEPEPAPEEPAPMPMPERHPLGALASSTPPGLVQIDSGRYLIGLRRQEVTDLIESMQLRPLASEYPQHSVNLDKFLYMPTEVTNEQYAVFVEATGSQPPQHWGQDAIDAAGLAFATETGRAKKDARDAGLPIPKFDELKEATWWRKNWQGAAWEVPFGLGEHPVVYVTYEQAEAYARWAGLRLVSEEEHQAVGRGGTARAYPWGDEFDPARANTVEAKLGRTMPVGSYPDGSIWVDERGVVVERKPENQDLLQGIHDLSGNVWEWTRSPYVAYARFKPLSVKIQGSKEKVSPEFDADHRVAVSGDFGSPPMATRLTTRRGTARWQATSAMGFRCSAGTTPGEDLIEHVLVDELTAFSQQTGRDYPAGRAVSLQRWVHRPPASATYAGTPPTYDVILAHDHLALVPVGTTGLADLVELDRRSLEVEVELGVLSTSIDLLEPRLVPGTYSVSYRAGGEDPRLPAGTEGPALPFDSSQPTMILRDATRQIVAAIPTDAPTLGFLLRGHASLEHRAAAPTTAEGTGPPEATLVHMELIVPSSVTDQGFAFRLSLAAQPGAVGITWLP